MTQDEKRIIWYLEVMEFLNENHRKPSKYWIDEHDMLNWLKLTEKP